MAAPNLEAAAKALPQVLEDLTQTSLDSIAELLEGVEGDLQEELFSQQFGHLSNACAQIQLDAEKMNPKWNKTYGEGGSRWRGDCGKRDGKARGGMPYYCPIGWARFSLNVAPDAEFETRFADWGYLYHGTKGANVGPILTSGFTAGHVHATGPVFMTPSIEYSGHPRYAGIEYQPETRLWVQVVLQCRVNPAKVLQVQPETMHATHRGIDIDPNVPNAEMEWLFETNYTDPQTKLRYVRDAIVCTGIMVRTTERHPVDVGGYWWSQEDTSWTTEIVKVNPHQPATKQGTWHQHRDCTIAAFTVQGDPLGLPGWLTGSNFKPVPHPMAPATVWISPEPFAKGGIRFARYLEAETGHDKLFVMKDFNPEVVRHIQDGLKITRSDAHHKDVATYLLAQQFAESFNEQMKCLGRSVRFLQPLIMKTSDAEGDHEYFMEEYAHGEFLKWNNNDGFKNASPGAQKNQADEVAAAFSHFTYQQSNKSAMIVDVQGWLGGGGELILTDPIIHTRSFNGRTTGRKSDTLYRRFSLGNHGKPGMIKFFLTHKCGPMCKHLQLPDVSHIPAKL